MAISVAPEQPRHRVSARERSRIHLRLAGVARDRERERAHGPRHREQASQTQHRSLAGSTRRQARHRRRAAGDRDPAVPEADQAETDPRWQASIDHMTPWFAIGLGPLSQPWGLVAARVAVIVEAKLSSWASYLALVLFCVITMSAFLATDTYAGFRPQPAQGFLARSRLWIASRVSRARSGEAGKIESSLLTLALGCGAGAASLLGSRSHGSTRVCPVSKYLAGPPTMQPPG
ncbi:MAG: GAP family protein [Streptosporangiaceae bacterium]